jgi:flagellin
MRSDNAALSAVSDALGMGAAKVDTAYTAVQSSIDVVTEIKAKLVAATEEGVDKTKIQDEITQLQAQLKSVAASASFNGQNWVQNSIGATMSVVSSFVRDSSGGVSVTTTSYITTATDLLFDTAGTNGILGTNGAKFTTASISSFSIGTTSTKGDIDKLISDTETALVKMTALGSKLGSMSTRIDLQSEFVSKLTDSIKSGVGRLVDADMEAESSRLTALQTQQQLAVQSLSIANSASQNILSLFRS